MTYYPLRMVAARFAGDISVMDPETGDEVELVVFKDPISGGMFAIDFTYLDQIEPDSIPSPFDPTVRLILNEEDYEYVRNVDS